MRCCLRKITEPSTQREGSCSWAEFAKEVFRLAGKATQVKAITTRGIRRGRAQAAYSVLENRMFKLTTDFMFADWHDAIAEYIKTL